MIKKYKNLQLLCKKKYWFDCFNFILMHKMQRELCSTVCLAVQNDKEILKGGEESSFSF